MRLFHGALLPDAPFALGNTAITGRTRCRTLLRGNPFGPERPRAWNAIPTTLQKLAKGEHKTLSCETCHGPSRAHVVNPAEKLPKLNISMCVRCHQASPSRPKWLHQINVHNHYTGDVCTECHVPHQPNEVP